MFGWIKRACTSPDEVAAVVRRTAYADGVDAYKAGRHLYSNPHVHRDGIVSRAHAWAAGWQWAWQQDNKNRED